MKRSSCKYKVRLPDHATMHQIVYCVIIELLGRFSCWGETIHQIVYCVIVELLGRFSCWGEDIICFYVTSYVLCFYGVSSCWTNCNMNFYLRGICSWFWIVDLQMMFGIQNSDDDNLGSTFVKFSFMLVLF